MKMPTTLHIQTILSTQNSNFLTNEWILSMYGFAVAQIASKVRRDVARICMWCGFRVGKEPEMENQNLKK